MIIDKPADIRAWQKRMNYSSVQAADALGMSNGGYLQMRQGIHRGTGKAMKIDKRTALACLAIEMLNGAEILED